MAADDLGPYKKQRQLLTERESLRLPFYVRLGRI